MTSLCDVTLTLFSVLVLVVRWADFLSQYLIVSRTRSQLFLVFMLVCTAQLDSSEYRTTDLDYLNCDGLMAWHSLDYKTQNSCQTVNVVPTFKKLTSSFFFKCVHAACRQHKFQIFSITKLALKNNNNSFITANAYSMMAHNRCHMILICNTLFLIQSNSCQQLPVAHYINETTAQHVIRLSTNHGASCSMWAGRSCCKQ